MAKNPQPTKKPPAAKAGALPSGEGTTGHEPEIVTIRIDLVEAETGERFKTSIPLPMYAPAVDYADAATNMTASRLLVSERGFTVFLVFGYLEYQEDLWAEWWQLHALHESEGLNALAAMQAFSLWRQTRKRGRGERGKHRSGIHRREFLICAALVEIARGKSQRAAVEAALNEHAPESTVKDAEALLRAVKRHLRTVR